MTEVSIKTEYIALGQFLKLAGIIDTGGAAKFFLQEASISINGESDNRRGRKLYSGDKIVVQGHGEYTVIKG
ncbi:S4 domain-containing protein YaaA [Paenibacillus oenotherae]|uniref:S4 domain-containing protein YaaA n=1 Tax=Paenibacillus oenotherae TaxID=1435645 RepID=A0ABS7D6Q6_9BACL|nr:S4 domain-containing protein YaaA [Paenibacillus oenotherae]MBW7475625.1 S4 domain-containing protein YaaA [Paenibacillus oenotherae]